MIQTPQSNRLHISIFGKCNSGKSSLINAITGQQTAIVSEFPGTTTDTVTKSMEVAGMGPCLFIDTAGFDDISILGIQRLEQTRKAADRADIAIMVYSNMDVVDETNWVDFFREKKVPVIAVVNYNEKKIDDLDKLSRDIKYSTRLSPIIINAKTGEGVQHLMKALIKESRNTAKTITITGNLVKEGDVVLLVMPQDIQAPEGRLILPQSQTIRELLDKKCMVICTTPEKLAGSLKTLSVPPDLVITDSQMFAYVNQRISAESKLTSFSVLFARYKGNIELFIEGAKKVEKLTESSRVLIAEACAHAPLNEDIGRVKIPRMLREKIGEGLTIDVVSGTDFPKDLTSYDLIIHCGACMFNRKQVLSRIDRAVKQEVAITNYGIVIAHLTGTLDKVVYTLAE